SRDWSSDVCSSDLLPAQAARLATLEQAAIHREHDARLTGEAAEGAGQRACGNFITANRLLADGGLRHRGRRSDEGRQWQAEQRGANGLRQGTRTVIRTILEGHE